MSSRVILFFHVKHGLASHVGESCGPVANLGWARGGNWTSESEFRLCGAGR